MCASSSTIGSTVDSNLIGVSFPGDPVDLLRDSGNIDLCSVGDDMDVLGEFGFNLEIPEKRGDDDGESDGEEMCLTTGTAGRDAERAIGAEVPG